MLFVLWCKLQCLIQPFLKESEDLIDHFFGPLLPSKMVKVDTVFGSSKLYTVADRLPTLEWC